MRAFFRNSKARYVVGLLVVISVLLTFGMVYASGGGTESVDILVYRIINFAVLAAAVIFLVRKPIAKGLASRRQGIKEKLEDLEKQQQEAEKQLAEQKQRFARLDQEVDKIVAEYIKEGEAAKARILEEAKVTAEKLQEQAKKNIEHEFQSAKQQLTAEMSAQAVTMAEALIKKSINDDDQKRIVDEYLTKVVVAQ